MPIKAQIQLYCDQSALSTREREVFALLVHRVVSPPELAARLGISVNTVNNHLKKIFGKTSTENKTELLADFLLFLERKNSELFLKRMPRLLLLDDESELANSLADLLRAEEMEVHVFDNPLLAINEIRKLRIDIVIADIKMPGMNGINFLEGIRKSHYYEPGVIFISGFTDEYSVAELLHKGAFALMEKPIDFKKLVRNIRKYIFSAPPSADRNQKQQLLLVENAVEFKDSELGFGGFFLHQNDVPVGALDRLRPGTGIRIKFRLPNSEKEFECNCEVVWERRESQGKLHPGFGLIFQDLDENTRSQVLDYVRINNIFSFVPIGEQTTKSAD